ncbi:MAG: ATP-binding cassette domain-containing protein [Solirubrobacterales bacterium]
MSSYLLFLLLGLGAGGVYAILGLGLVLKFRSAGVVDFGHGAVAMFCAYVFIELHSAGSLIFPWVALPHSIEVASSTGLPLLPSIFATLAYSAVLGLIFYLVIYRPLRAAPALARVGASVGVMLALEAIAVINFGTTTFSSPPILPSTPIDIAGLSVPSDRLYLAGITILLGAALGFVYRYTRFGLVTRASAENETGAALLGHSANRIAAANWVLATVLAAAAGILILPITTLNPSTYTLFIVPALGAALLARFRSFTIVVIAGLALGMFQSELTKLQAVWTWLPQQGLQEGLPFLLIMIAMVVLAGRLPARGTIGDFHNPSIGRPARPGTTAIACFAIGAIALGLSSSLYQTAIISSLVTICVCLSVVVVTGYVGQISLAQNAFAGVGAFILVHLATGIGIGFPFGLILAALAAVVLGVLVGLPAVRIRGVNLAVATLATAAALDALVFNNSSFSGGYTGLDVPSPHLFGLNVGIEGAGHEYPRLVFALFVLAIVVGIGWLVARLRNGAIGRMFIAVRSNDRAASSLGINVARTKLLAFAISAFIAGIGGGLLAYQQQNVNSASFTVWTSLTILAITYVGGVGRIAGASAAGILLASNGIAGTVLEKQVFSFGKYQALIAGVALTATAVGNPDGIAKDMTALAHRIGRKLAPLLPRRGPAPAEAESPPGAPEPPAPHPRPRPVALPEGPLLQVDGLSVRYGGVVAVNDVSFELQPGTIVGLIGPNGAGKTSAIDALAGFVTPSTGEVRFKGDVVTGERAHKLAPRGLIRTFQSVELFDDLTVEENLLAASDQPSAASGLLQLLRISHRPDRADVDWALGICGLTDVAKRYPRELSLGRRKLVGVARSLASRPALLLLDEPAAGLDTEETSRLGEQLRTVSDHGVTLLLVDHDMGLVLNVCDTVMVLEFGSLIASGSSDEIRKNTAVIEAYLGEHAPETEKVEAGK